MSARAVLLMDNGSLEPAATLRLRKLAAALGERCQCAVEPVSLLHSSGVPAAKTEGVPAEIIEPAIRRRAGAGFLEFLVVPLFFGPSRALTDYLPGRVAALREVFPRLRVALAAPLSRADDDRLGRILADQVSEVAGGLPPATGPIPVALVDHGSPVAAVAAVRDRLAEQLGDRLGSRFHVAPASMERREGAGYDFCEPLLERLLAREGWNQGDVVVAMQFLQPGRHAGPAGDVARICRQAEANAPGLRTHLTALVGDHPLLLDILADRLCGASQEL